MATKFDRPLYRGDTLFFLDQVFQDVATRQLFTVPVTNPPTPPPPGSAPFNLAGCTVWYTAKNTTVDPDLRAVFELSTGALGGVAVVNASLGLFSVTGPALATVGFPDGDVALEGDVQVRDASGNVFTVERGTLTVTADVTRAIA